MSGEREALVKTESTKNFYFAQKPRSYSTTATDSNEVTAGLLERTPSPNLRSHSNTFSIDQG